MESWKKYFESSGVDLWTLCERALMVAYKEDPGDFPMKRDVLAQKIFAPEKLDLQACEKDTPVLRKSESPSSDERKDGHCDGLREPNKCEVGSDDIDYIIPSCNRTHDEAEALTEAMDEEILVKNCVLSIKELLQHPYQSQKEVLESLQRLDHMQLSFDVLKDTQIGRIVKSLRKHSSKQVCAMAKQLVSGWKHLVDEWVKSAKHVAEAASGGTAGSDDSEVLNEYGLPSPPMDDGALLTTQTPSMELSQLLDFMDVDTSAGSGANSPEDDHQCSIIGPKKPCDNAHTLPNADVINNHSQHQSARLDKRSNLGGDETNGKGSAAKLNHEKEREPLLKVCNGTGVIEKNVRKYSIEKRPDTRNNQNTQALKYCACLAASMDDSDYDEKVQATKRKLHEKYEQAENAKKQRTIQVMNLEDLPKGGPNRAKASNLGHNKLSFQHCPRTRDRK